LTRLLVLQTILKHGHAVRAGDGDGVGGYAGEFLEGWLGGAVIGNGDLPQGLTASTNRDGRFLIPLPLAMDSGFILYRFSRVTRGQEHIIISNTK
jgi:hypothetical protein